MVTAILSQEETDLNSPELDDLDRPHEIVIRMGLRGIRSMQIFADESATEERLRERLLAAHLILEQLHETMSISLPQGYARR